MDSFDLLKLPWLGLGLGFFRISDKSHYHETPGQTLLKGERFQPVQVMQKLPRDQNSTRDIGYESNSWVRPSMSGVYQTIGLMSEWWLILDHLPPSYGLHQIFWLDCAFLHLNFRVWNFRWKWISFKLKNFQVQKKRDLKQSVSVTNAGTVAQSDSLGTFDKMHSDQFYVWVMLDSCSIQSH